MKYLVLLFVFILLFLSCGRNRSNESEQDFSDYDELSHDEDGFLDDEDSDAAENSCVYEEPYKKDIIISPSSNIWRYFLMKPEPQELRFLVKEYGETVSEGDQWDPKGTRRIGLDCYIMEEDKELLDDPLKSEYIAITFQNYFEKDFIDGLKNLKAPLSIYLKVILFSSVDGEAASKEIYTIRDGDGDLIIAVVLRVTEEEKEALEIWPSEYLPEFDAKQIMPEEGCIENTNLVESDDGFITDSYVNPLLEVKHVPSGQTVVAMEHEYKDLENFKVYVYSSGTAGPKDYDGLLSFIGRKWSFSFFAVSKKILE